MTYRFPLFIGGEWRDSQSKEYLPVYNPWNGELFAEVASATIEDVEIQVQQGRSS
jgi:acyl-CoA reductase-like NAD-dependent aldehyde dehydrogenase